MHRWAFDGERLRDSVGSAHLSLSGALASMHTVGSSDNAVLRLPTTDDFAISQPLGPATLATSFALVACFRFDPMPTDGLDGDYSSSVHAERTVLTLIQSPRVSSSFIELTVVQSAGLDSRNRSACVYSARIRDEGGSSVSGVLGLATGIVQFACWTLVVARSEAVLYVNGAPVLRHPAALLAPFRSGLASIAIGHSRWAQNVKPPMGFSMPLEVDLVEIYDHDLTAVQSIARTAEIRCRNGLRDELLLERPRGGLSGFFEDAVDCVSRSASGVTEPCALCSARCRNGVQDGDEDAIDCGGSACGACAPANVTTERCVRFDQLVIAAGVRRIDVPAVNGAAIGVVAHSGLKLVDNVVGLVQCVQCPPLTSVHLFRYTLVATTPLEAVEVACDAALARSHDGCFGRALESDPKHAWFVVDLGKPVVLQEVHWWLHWRSPGCVRTADIEVAGDDFRFRPASSAFEFDVGGAAMQVISLDPSSTGAGVRFVRVVSRVAVGDDASRRYTPAFRRILFYRHATAEDSLPLTGSGGGIGVGDDRLPLALHASLIDRNEILSVTFHPPMALEAVTLAIPPLAIDPSLSTRATLARWQCTEATSRRTLAVDLRVGTTVVHSSRATPQPVSSCLLTAAGAASFQLASVCFA